MRRFVLGDIHGNFEALKQCFERSSFDKEHDQLIQLGDICDGWHQVYECVEELLGCKNLIVIKGNHDEWFNQWLQTGTHSDNWRQGGEGTLRSYCKYTDQKYEVSKYTGISSSLRPEDVSLSHHQLFKNQLPYYLDEQRNLFVHGGFSRHYTIKENEKDPHIFYWDRDLLYAAMSAKSGNTKLKYVENFNEIYVGHTTTQVWKTTEPIFADKVINVDTGAGWNGVLTIMDIDTKQYWQSDPANKLYPMEKLRR